jgi:GDP-L-fucose synthase
MPCSLYGQNDNFDLQNSHLIPALVRKMHEAKTNNYSAVEIWGSGKPLREFLYVDDMANACIFLMNNYFDNQLINIGCGYDYSVKQIAEIIKDIVGYDGELVFDESKPDGVYRKLLDVSKINSLGWKPKIDLKQGIEIMYRWYCNKM